MCIGDPDIAKSDGASVDAVFLMEWWGPLKVVEDDFRLGAEDMTAASRTRCANLKE